MDTTKGIHLLEGVDRPFELTPLGKTPPNQFVFMNRTSFDQQRHLFHNDLRLTKQQDSWTSAPYKQKHVVFVALCSFQKSEHNLNPSRIRA